MSRFGPVTSLSRLSAAGRVWFCNVPCVVGCVFLYRALWAVCVVCVCVCVHVCICRCGCDSSAIRFSHFDAWPLAAPGHAPTHTQQRLGQHRQQRISRGCGAQGGAGPQRSLSHCHHGQLHAMPSLRVLGV